MRLPRLLSLLGFLALAGFAVAPPLHAAAGTTSGPQLALSPNQGAPGSHFTATFTYSVPVCNRYKVWLFWDASTPSQGVLGSAEPANTDSACQVSIAATIPADARSATHTVDAEAHLDTTSGTSASSSNDPQATATYVVAQPLSQSSSSSSSSSSPASSSRPGGSSPGATGSGVAAATALGPSPGAPADSATASSSSSDAGLAPSAPGSSTPPVTPPGTGVPLSRPHRWGAAVALGVALLAVVGLVAAWRSGRLRLPPGRR